MLLQEVSLTCVMCAGIQFIETSALDSTNVDKAFYKVISDIYQQTVQASES